MLKATITKVSRNVSSPQVDVEVTYSDDKGFEVSRVFTMGYEESDKESVIKLITKSGQEYKTTLFNEDKLVKELVGEEIVIE